MKKILLLTLFSFAVSPAFAAHQGICPSPAKLQAEAHKHAAKDTMTFHHTEGAVKVELDAGKGEMGNSQWEFSKAMTELEGGGRRFVCYYLLREKKEERPFGLVSAVFSTSKPLTLVGPWEASRPMYESDPETKRFCKDTWEKCQAVDMGAVKK